MNIEKCKLYKINRKRDLYKLLKISDWKRIEITRTMYNIRIENGKRLIEAPCDELKLLQKRLLRLLYDIEFDKNIFSGIRGRSAYDNAYFHLKADEILKFDMQKFFPNTPRENIYKFFKEKLLMSSDTAKICTDIVTVDYSLMKIPSEVECFLKEKHIKSKNHLPSGTPTSQILSYLANKDMFDELNNYAKHRKMKLSVYVDDLTFSIIDSRFKKADMRFIGRVIKKYGYSVSKKKTKRYKIDDFKKITGFVISPNKELVVPNKIRLKINKILNRKEQLSNKEKASLNGMINFAQMSEKNRYNNQKMN